MGGWQWCVARHELMDGPDPDATGGIRAPTPPCPKMVGEWHLAQESQITADERVSEKLAELYVTSRPPSPRSVLLMSGDQ